ncbi:MAG: DNA polymerase/3'-5' exonuclease PolX [Haloferacaceae archaeon]
MRNDEVARQLAEFADRLEATGVEYKPRSYRLAAETVREHPEPIEDVAARGDLDDLDRVGDAIASKVAEYLETGAIEELEELRADLPVDIEALTTVEGVGPKTVGKLYEALGISDLDELEAAAEAGEIRTVSGFGAKTEENIRENVAFARQATGRVRLGEARPLAEATVALVEDAGAERAESAGSLRRWSPTVGDVDVLAATTDPAVVVSALTGWDRVETVIEAGETKASVRVDGTRVDLRVAEPREFGAALQYFTGSWDHNVKLRNRAIERDLKMNEYGVFDVSGLSEEERGGQRAGERVAGETETGMYETLDLPQIPPELREDRGEVEAAAEGSLPDLLAPGDVRGDLHTHTEWSDGEATAAEMARAAADRGADYHAITDHATGPGMVGGVGLSDDRLREQIAAVEDLDAPLPVLTGVETNVDADGDLSTGDDVLAELDVVVASPHSGLGQDRETATERLIRAVEHPEVDVLGHPTGRLITERPGLAPDVERVAAAAADAGTALEVNADPRRLDLDGDAVRVAVEAGASVAVDTDAHRPATLANVRYGVHTARRGWATTADVINTRSLDGLRSFLDG